jgi:hypothetical protein
MRSFTSLKGLFTTLTNNTSTANDTLGGQLINDQHRYLIQKYFDNERTVTISTVGGQSLTLTGALIVGATSATLTGAWAYGTASQLVNFSSGEQRPVLFTNGSTAITWTVPLTATATTAISSVGVQAYPIPADVSKIKNGTINIGQLKYSPVPVETRAEWDIINTLPYTSDIPNFFFIYNGKMEFFPIPSTTGNVITFNYKSRVADLSFADYSTGNIASAGMVAGSTSVTGLATSWSTTGKYPTGTDISYYNLKIKADVPNGDGMWYPISKFTSDTVLTTSLPIVNAPNIIASTTYSIGQFPVLHEDFHDMLVYGALKVYYSTIVKDANAFKEAEALYQERLDLLKDYAGTKQVNVDLGTEPAMINPNLFMFKN